MGRRGPLAKPAAEAQGHRHRADLVPLPTAAPAKIPRAPSGLLAETRKAWRAFWQSPIAAITEEVDLPAVRRLFRLYDQLERAWAVVEQALVVKGSTGQVRVNPVGDWAIKLEGQILRLENELGLTPMARARLGLTVAQGRLTVEEINRIAREPRRDENPIDAELAEEWTPAE